MIIVKNETKFKRSVGLSDGSFVNFDSGESKEVSLTIEEATNIQKCSDLTFVIDFVDPVDPVDAVDYVELDTERLEAAIADGFKVDGRWSEKKTAEELEKFFEDGVSE